MNIEIFPTPSVLTQRAAELFVECAARAVQERGSFAVALSGGSTPRALYQRLAEMDFSWQNIHLFWGDERCVPPDHADSNYRMAAESLLQKILLPPENIHRIAGELPPAEAAAAYEGELRRFFGAAPRFDLILLGLGEDGHTASLFPGSTALEETTRWVLAAEHAAPPLPLVPRVTLTLPALNASRQVVFLVSGAGKAQRLAQVLRAPTASPSLPASRIRPASGDLLWMVDQPAAALLS